VAKEVMNVTDELAGSEPRTAPPSQEELFYLWCEAEARKINSDGCTAVSEWHERCCFEHDLACHYGKDPRAAALAASKGVPNYWEVAPKLSRRDADKRFAGCNFHMSRNPLEYLRSGIRFLGVRLGALFG
jgi:hypothetical protein